MTTIDVSRDDIDALAAAVDRTTLPPGAARVLGSLITAIGELIGEQDEPVTVTVEAGTLHHQFDAAFTPEDAPAFAAGSGHGIRVTVTKIGR